MTLPPGSRLGPYEIESALGAGGMGEVYRARDTRLDRTVAIKVLSGPESSPLNLRERFEREGKVVARLNHPNICGVYDVGRLPVEGGGAGSGDEVDYLVMEHVVGETLASKIDAASGRGGLAPAEAVEYAVQIGRALGAAHAEGVIHRDIKPSNAIVTPSGVAKVLDFGLAKLARPTAPWVATATDGRFMTSAGAVMGTPDYMSPEQALGRDADARSDLFSLGVVLYEMLAGRPPFGGATPTEVADAILHQAPAPLGGTRRLVPAALERIVGRLLEKDRTKRYQTAEEVVRDLERVRVATSIRTMPAQRSRWITPAVAAGVGVAGLAAVVFAGFDVTGLISRVARLGSPPPVAVSLGAIRQVTSLPGLEEQPTLSPDGRMVAFVWQEADNRDIWVQQVSGGTPLRIAPDPADDVDPDWSPDGSLIVFRSGRLGGGIFVVPALGGDVTRLTSYGYRPRWSPDGRRVLFQVRPGTLIPNEVHVATWPDGNTSTLLPYRPGDVPYLAANWSPDGQFLVARSGGLSGIPRGLVVTDADARTAPIPVWPGDAFRGFSAIWLADRRGLIVEADTLGYLPLDRNGRAAGPFERLTTSADALGDVSADGRLLAFVGRRSSQSDIWKIAIDPATGLTVGDPVPVIVGSAEELSPYVLPDNQHLLFLSNRDGQFRLYVAGVEGRTVRLVDRTGTWRGIRDISPDGRTIALFRHAPIEAFLLDFDPATLEMRGAPRSMGPVVPGTFAPDGRYLLYQTAEASPMVVSAWERRAPDQFEPITWSLSPEFTARFPSADLDTIFSADGNWVLFGFDTGLDRNMLFAVRRGGGDPHVLWEGTWQLIPSRDPRRAYFWMPRGDGLHGEIGFVTIDPATAKVVSGYRRLDFEQGNGTVRSGHGSISPDGRWLFFAWAREEGDIQIADLIVR